MLKSLKAVDYLIFIIFIFLIVLSFLNMPERSDELHVQVDEREYTFPLDKDGIYSVSGPLGETEIEIKSGEARIISSPCPNKTCIAQGFSDTLICLPNHVVATVLLGEEAIDDTAY